ncbi:MAG: acyltransferase [bacterium]|nr:acyltransferase [bacterium]MCM1500349.1 acyltransferase [Clostridium sp.]
MIERITFAIENYWPNVLQIAVPMFFFISGILFFKSFTISNLAGKWKSRLFTVVLPYIIWCTIYYIYYVVITNIPIIRSLMSTPNIVRFSISEWVRWLWVSEYYTLWFLQELIIFIAAAPVIWLLLNNHRKKFPTGLVALIALILIKQHSAINIPYTSGLDIYLVGSYIGLNCRELLAVRNKVLAAISLLYVIFTLVTAFRFWNIITEILLFIAIWFACDLLPLAGKKLPWWMSITFFTYVAHDAFLEAFEKIILVIFGKKAVFALLDYLFAPILVEIVLILIAYLLKMRLPMLWKILTGNRNSETSNEKI